MQDNEIYKFMKANGLTDKDEKTFLNEYSNPKKAKEVFDFFKANELTDKDETSFYDTYLKKKDSSVSSATPSQLPKISEQVSPLQQGANIVGGGVIGDISKTVPKEGTKKENQYFKQRFLGVRPSAEGDIVERVYDDPMGVGVLKVEPPKREVKPQEKPVAKAETKDKSIRGVKPIAPTEYEYDPQGWLLNMVSALDKGVYKTLGTTAQGAGTLLQGVTSKITGGTGEGFISDALIKFGDSYNKMIDELTPQDESFKGSLSDQVGQALGFVGGLALTGGASSVARGSSALMQQAPKSGALTSAVKELVKGTVSPTGVVGGLTMGQAEFDRAKQSGATDEQAFEAFYKNAAVGSVLERIPVMHFLKRFNKSTAGGVVNYIKTKGVAGLTGGLEEMTTEMLQQLYANKTAKDIYNTNQDLFEGVVGNGTIGFSVGFLLNAMGANAKILRKQGKVNEAKLVENQVKELQEKAKGVVPTNNAITTKIAVNGNEEGLQRTQAELNNDLQKGLISEEEYQEKAAIAQRVADFNAKIPDFVQGANRAESIQLIEERENLQQELLQKEEQKKSIDVAYHKVLDEANKEVKGRIDEINNQLAELAKPENNVEEEIQQPIDFSNKSDIELENRQTELENAKFGTKESKEFNDIDKELQKREWRMVFDSPLDKVNEVVDELIKKDKEMPNGWGSYIDSKDARLTKEVADKYKDASSLPDSEVINDFKDAMFGNPSSYYSDGLKLRESLRVASERGLNVLDNLAQEFINDGYGKEDAVNMAKRKLEPILQNATQEQQKQVQQIPNENIQPQEEVVVTERVEVEPDLAEGQNIVTLSGMVESERNKAVEERRKKTTLTEKETLHNDLIDLANRVQKSRGNEKTNLQGKIRQKVRELNAKLGEEVYRYDGVSVRSKVKSKTKGERYLKIKGTTRDTSGRAIKEDAVTLFDRNPDFVQKYEELAESPNITSLQVNRGDGVSMTAEQIKSALQDIADGIPSVQADNLLNVLEDGFNKGYFDLRGKDIGQDIVQASVEDFIGFQQEEVGQPMDEDALMEYLNDESQFSPEEDEQISEDLKNLINEYESQSQKTVIEREVSKTKPTAEVGSPKPTQSDEKRKADGEPKADLSKEPIGEAKADKSPLEQEYEEANNKKGEKAKQKAKEKIISDNFDGIVAQLMTKNKIKRKC